MNELQASAYQWLQSAVDANKQKNDEIGRAVLAQRSFFTSGRRQPRPAPALSEIMCCEENGAAPMLERFFSAVKRFPVGAVPRDPLNEMLSSSTNLLRAIEGLLRDLPRGLWDIKEQALRNLVEVRRLEVSAHMLIMDEYGAGPDCSLAERFHRMDKHQGNFKKALGALRADIVCLEERIEKGDFRGVPRPPKVTRRRGKTQYERDEADLKKREDRKAIAAELRRRMQYRFDQTGEVPHLKPTLDALLVDEAWKSRCGQWTYDSLYRYMRAALARWRPVGYKR